MARRRMIDPNFWQSEDVSKLSIRQRLLFIGLFSNSDDEGKLRGNPAFVRSIIFPYEDFTLDEIERDLNDIEAVGSILQYVVDGSKYILLVNWKKFQRVDKPQRSVIPEPDKNHSENDSDNDSRLKERNLKEKNLEEDNMANVVVENPYVVFEREGFGTITDFVKDEIEFMSKEYGDQWICDAMRVSVKKGKRKLSFVEGILKNWKADGRDSYQDNKTARFGPGEREAEIQQRKSEERKNNVVEMNYLPDPMLSKVVGND